MHSSLYDTNQYSSATDDLLKAHNFALRRMEQNEREEQKDSEERVRSEENNAMGVRQERGKSEARLRQE